MITTRKVKVWITRDQLGGPLFFNSFTHADACIEGKEFEERDSKWAALKALGVKEYSYLLESEISEKMVKEGSILRSQADVDSYDVENMREDMRQPDFDGPSESNAAASSGRAKNFAKMLPEPKVKPELSPEEKTAKLERAALEKEYNKGRADILGLSTKIKKESQIVETAAISLRLKKFPESFIEFMQAQKAQQIDAADHLNSEWQKYSVLDLKSLSMAELQDHTTVLAKLFADSTTAFANFKKDHLDSFIKK